MTDNFTREQFDELATHNSFPAVTIYMPVHEAGREVNEGKDALKFKNHINDLSKKLGFDRNNKGFLEPAFDLIDQNDFWVNQSKGLAIFLAPGIFKVFRMPFSFSEKVTLAPSFSLAPMVRFCQKDNHFFLLCLSKGSIRMFNCTEYNIDEMALDPSLPRNMKDALWMDDPEVHQQQHSTGIGPGRSIFHGHGAGEDSVKTDIRRYFQKMNDGLMKMLGKSNAPLIVAAVDYLIPIFREACDYSFVFPEGIKGNPEHISLHELHKKSLDLVNPYFEKDKLEALDRFNNMLSTKLVSSDVEDIIPASHYQKVDVLFLADDESLWGRFDKKTAGVDLHKSWTEGDEDLLSRAAVDTVLNGGRVFLLDKNHLPESAKYAAAIYRFQ